MIYCYCSYQILFRFINKCILKISYFSTNLNVPASHDLSPLGKNHKNRNLFVSKAVDGGSSYRVFACLALFFPLCFHKSFTFSPFKNVISKRKINRSNCIEHRTHSLATSCANCPLTASHLGVLCR